MKQGNNHSTLLEKLAAAAQPKSDAPPVNKFASELLTALQQTARPQPTLRSILTEARMVKTAQFEDPAMDPMAADIEPGAGSSEPGAGNGEPGLNEEAKNLIARALVEICGGPEEAKMCIDTCCAGESAESPELPGGEMTDMPLEEPLSEISADMPMPMPMG